MRDRKTAVQSGFREACLYFKNMKTLNTIHASLIIGFLLTSLAYSSSIVAHELYGSEGKPTHEHVYKRNAYGKGVTVGHYAQPAGSRGIVIWQASPSQGYARKQPGLKIPQGPAPQVSQKQLFRQAAVFSKYQSRTPGFGKK